MTRRDACLLFDYYKQDAFTLFNYERFKDAAAGLIDIFPVRHLRPSELLVSRNLIAGAVNVTNPNIFDRIAHRKERRGSVAQGNHDLKMLSACRKIPGYQHYISVEYDVVFLGKPRDSLAMLMETAVSGDLGASRFTRKQEWNSHWVWWPGLQAPEGSSIDLEAIATSAFLPIVSLSRDFAAVYEQKLTEGWIGHYEALLPTIAKLCDARLADFNETEPRLTRYEQFDTDPPKALSLEWSLFAHPIKSVSQFDELMSAVG